MAVTKGWERERESGSTKFGHFIAEPVETFVETLSLGGASGLNIPAAATQIV